MFMRNYKEILPLEVASKFSIFDLKYGFDYLGFLTNTRSMGLLQGLKLMAWTTKSLIRGNHWVP